VIINSQFKDYYDFVAHQYRDEKVVYNRKTLSSDQEGFPENETLKKFALKHTWDDMVSSWSDKKKLIGVGGCNVLIIGGKPYPFTVGENRQRNFKNPYEYIKNITKEKKPTFLGYIHRNKSELKSGEINKTCIKICQEVAPIILIYGWRKNDYKYNNHYHNHIVLNPCIRDIKPPVDGWTVVQDLMCVLGSVEPHIPEMDNVTKIASHGFDKRSFKPKMKA